MYSTSSSGKRPLIVGITGGMGSGKSTVAQCFEALGVPCFCADKEAATLYEDALFLKALRKALGNKAFDKNGRADKKAIANIVFNDKGKLQELNNIVHPRVMQMFEKWVEQRLLEPYVLFESAVIFESGLQVHFDKIISVYAPIDIRIRRIVTRDKTTAELAMERIGNQMDDEKKAHLADYVVRNYYGPKHRQHIVQSIHNKILKHTTKQ